MVLGGRGGISGLQLELVLLPAVPVTETEAVARVCPDWSATSATLTGSARSELLLASDPVYFVFGRTAIPQ